MRLKFYLTICFVQVLSLANAMEDRDHIFEPFLSAHLPYSVKKGEIINVPVVVYNYLRKTLDVVITLDNSNAKYEIIDFASKVISEPIPSKSIVGIRPYNTATVHFLIRPKVIGRVKLKINATYVGDYDFLYKTINVVTDGVTSYYNFNFKVILGKEYTDNYISSVGLGLSHYTELGIVGDITGLVLQNLKDLTGTLTGCGEETMSSMLLNYLFMKYLKNLLRLSPNIKASLKPNLEIGCQRMLDYHNWDGSFTTLDHSRAWEERKYGSTLLTSYFLRFLPHFKEFINVNATIIENGLAYLSKQQADDGSFTEKGEYSYESQRNPIVLTGAALLAFLENPVFADKYLQNITKGLEFIAKNLENYKLLHMQALATYAANMAKHETTKKLSLTKWLSETSLDDQKEWWHNLFLSNVEITSYKLLMLLDLNSAKIDNTTVKGLIDQRISLGFATTQKTIVGLTDLIKSADFGYFEPAKMDLNIISRDKNKTIKLTEYNGVFYASVELNPETTFVKIAASGKGSALIEIAKKYEITNDTNYYYTNFIISKNKLYNNQTYLNMSVCVNYVGTEKFSNITLLAISTPSGYVINGESLNEMDKLKNVIGTEVKNSGSLLVVYFDSLLPNVEICLTVEALRTYAVAMQKSANIQLYDYYNEDKRIIAFYDVDSKLCDICITEEQCSKCK